MPQGQSCVATVALKTFAVSQTPLVFGIDETLERRWGAKINARRIYQNPGALQQKPFCESQCVEGDVPDVANGDPVRTMGMGITLFHGSGSVRTLCPGSPQNTKKVNRLGPPDSDTVALLVTFPSSHSCC